MHKILLVEDDRSITIALEVRMKMLGYEVACAVDGDTAMNKMEASKPDLIVLDVHLSGDDGLAVAKRILENPMTVAMPIVFITASLRPDIRTKAAELGATAFLEKPFSSSDFTDALETSLQLIDCCRPGMRSYTATYQTNQQ